MRLLILGASGQVGQSLIKAVRKRRWEGLGLSHAELDICDESAVAEALRRHAPTALINAAGYTAVDKAETEQERAFAANCQGTRILAQQAAAAGLPLIHFSTDYVFDGGSTVPYLETDPVNPLGVYAKSKEAAERAVRASAPQHVILRTAWLYSPFGTNFVRTMLRLGVECNEICVVDDQTGCPTSAADVAEAIIMILAKSMSPGFNAWGTYHWVGADAITWFGFAREIFEGAARYGVKAPKLRAVATPDVPRPAPRPAYSVLATEKLERTFGLRPRRLHQGLTECLNQLLT